MSLFHWEKELKRQGHRIVIAGQPIAMHCHHYNINLQKTVEDTLGQEGIDLLCTSAEEASCQGFKFFFGQYPEIRTEKSRLEMAALLYQNCGLGIIHFQKIGAAGGRISSSSSHHVTGWLAKHGLRDSPGCHFARGWIAGLLNAVFERPLGHYCVSELYCKMMRQNDCIFDVKER